MANDSKFDSGSFLGGAGKFNKAGDNVPLPGEAVSDVPAPLPFGGPKIWISTLVIIALLTGLFFFYEAPHMSHPTTNPRVTPESGLPDNPDAPADSSH